MQRTKSSAFGFRCLTLFGGFPLASIVAVAMLTLGLGGHNRAEADIVVATPPGLNPGDTFRIAFVTDLTTKASPHFIATYNDFVNNDVGFETAGGAVTYNGSPLTFSAIGSAEDVDAITNIGQTGAPVYLVDGTEIASSDTSSAGGLWSGSLLQPLHEDLQGINQSQAVWTGTLPDGHARLIGFLGDVHAGQGSPSATDSDWISIGGDPFSFNLFPMYGISDPLTVPTPEPSSIVLGMLAAGCAVGAYVRRRMAGRRGL